MRIDLLPPFFAIARLEPDAAAPAWPGGTFVSVTRTPEELSVVCEERHVPEDVRSERGWRCFRVKGPIAFEVTGVASAFTGALAAAAISVFVVATFDTDYFLVKQESLAAAIAALRAAGFDVRDPDGA